LQGKTRLALIEITQDLVLPCLIVRRLCKALLKEDLEEAP
jgi:hypothetical protein